MDARGDEASTVKISPPDMVERHIAQWDGFKAEITAAKQQRPFDYRFHSERSHVLIIGERSERNDGETFVDGLPKSTQRNLSQRLTFIPAGHQFYGWQNPRVLARATYFHIDRRAALLNDDVRFSEIEFRPRLFFCDADLWRIATCLKEQALGGARPTRYSEALAILLGHELMRLNDRAAPEETVRGGLSAWQQKKVTEFIETHLADDVRLSTLADLVGLSPFHFARAFKTSVGVPPLRYHSNRRIERAKTMLETPKPSITEVALSLGFSESSAFSAAFRKTTGMAPREYRRSRR